MITTWKTAHDAICHSMKDGKTTMAAPTIDNLLQLEHESDGVVECENYVAFTSLQHGWRVITVRMEERGRPLDADAVMWRGVAIRLARAVSTLPSPRYPLIEEALREYAIAIAKEHA
jgi:hypothetical protein